MFRKLRNNIGAVILIVILGLILLGATYVNLGPTSLIDGDIGVTAGHGYYIDDVLLTYSDVNAQQADDALTNISGLTYVEDSLIKFTANDTYTVRTLAEIKADLSLDYVENLKVKLDATQAPTVDNDTDEGYVVGSRWFDITNDKEYVCLDNTDGAAVWTETTGAGGGATTFLGLTDTPAAYTDQAGKYVKVNAGENALEFGTPAGGGDMLKATYDTDEDDEIDVAGGGTEKDSWTLYCIPYLSGTTAFGEIPIGTAEYALTVNAGENGYDWTLFDLSLYYLKTEIDTQGEVETIWGVTLLNDITGESIGDLSDVDLTDIADEKILQYNSTSGNWECEDASGGYTNLTSFVDQTAWRLFHSNTDGDITELALGTDGQVLTSGGVAVAPSFEDASGAGETNTASNIGSEIEIYKQKTGVDLELRTLKANSSKVTISITPEGGEIDIGVEAINRGTNRDATYTYINKGNPANQNGTITSVEIWAATQLLNCEVAIFTEGDANVFTTRDNVTIGTVDSGSKQTFVVSLDVVAGDFLGINFTGGSIEKDTSSFPGEWRCTGDQIPCTDTTFTLASGAAISLYGTGVTSILDYIKFDIVESEIRLDDLKATEDNADLNASTSAHGLMPKLPFSGDLLSTTTVAFNADADTTLYTVPTGKRCILTHAIVVAAADAGATTTISIGANGAETDFVPANTLSNLDTQYDSVILTPIPNTTPLKIKSYAAATVIEAQVASQSGAAGNTIYLFGITY